MLRDTSLRIQSLQEAMRSATTESEIQATLRSSAASFGVRDAHLVMDSRLSPDCPVGELKILRFDGTTARIGREDLVSAVSLAEPPTANRIIIGLQTRDEGFGYMLCDVDSDYLVEMREIARTIGNRLLEHHHTRKPLEAERYAGLASLLHGFAHHVNTPLGVSVTAMSVIQTELDLLRSHGGTITQEELQRLGDAAEVMSRNLGVIRRLVELFQRLSAVSDYSHWSYGNVDTLVANIVESERPVLRHAGIMVESDCAAGNRETAFPSDIVRFVLHELTDNSVRHAFPSARIRDPAVAVTLTRRRGHLVIDYRDSGIGLPSDRRGDPFAPFSRLGRQDEGLGTGLFAVKRIVQDMLQGEVELGGADEAGFRLTLSFPIPSGRPERF
jgi:K+-sensing histidine kinase KdpD